MNIRAILFLAILCSNAAHAQHAAALAETAMKTLWVDAQHTGPHPAKWTYDQSVVLRGIDGLWLRTADPRYFRYMQQSMDRFVEDDGRIQTYKLEDYNIDNVACGRILLALYKVTGKKKYFTAAATLREQLRKHPRTAEGSFWHKKIYPNQVWLDGLYMAQPFYAEWAATFGEGDSVFTDIADQFIRIERQTRDKKTGLMRHAYDESRQMAWADSITGLAPNVWARAMGWYGAALVDVLEIFPATHPRRAALEGVLRRYADAVTKAQDKDSGLWWDVMNAPYPGAKGNYFEASAACQFVYALSKGVRLGVLKSSYLKTARKGYAGILKKFVVPGDDGLTHLDGTVSVSGLGGKPYRDGSFAYYISEKVVRDDAKGVGAFIQAANEMEVLESLGPGKGKRVLLDSYFNDEHDTDPLGRRRSWHYKWGERANGGFHFLGAALARRGAQTSTLYAAPTAANLKSASVYILVDPDIQKENPDARLMNEPSAAALHAWVSRGGTLVLLLNDSGNCDLTAIATLTRKFGFEFNRDSRNRVTGDRYEIGALTLSASDVFPRPLKVYLKEISTAQILNADMAQPLLTEGGDVLMVSARVGKGRVLAVGDPWIYNEYVDGRKLPADFKNFAAMEALCDWMLAGAR